MSVIEKLIFQKKFKSEYEKNVVTLMYTANVLNDFQNNFFKESKITRQQYNALRILKGQYPAPSTVGLIKERLIEKNSDASRMVDRLCKLELVERLTSKTDKRVADIRITKKGIKLLDALAESIDDFGFPFKVLSKKESETLNDLLNKVLKKIIEKKS